MAKSSQPRAEKIQSWSGNGILTALPVRLLCALDAASGESKLLTIAQRLTAPCFVRGRRTVTQADPDGLPFGGGSRNSTSSPSIVAIGIPSLVRNRPSAPIARHPPGMKRTNDPVWLWWRATATEFVGEGRRVPALSPPPPCSSRPKWAARLCSALRTTVGSR